MHPPTPVLASLGALLAVTAALAGVGARDVSPLADERRTEGFETPSSVELVSQGDATATRVQDEHHNGSYAARVHCPTTCGYPNDAMVRFPIDGKLVVSVGFWSKTMVGDVSIGVNVDDPSVRPSVNISGDKTWTRHELKVDRCTENLFLRTYTSHEGTSALDDVEIQMEPNRPGCYNPYSPTCSVHTVTVAPQPLTTCIHETVTVTRAGSAPADASPRTGADIPWSSTATTLLATSLVALLIARARLAS